MKGKLINIRSILSSGWPHDHSFALEHHEHMNHLGAPITHHSYLAAPVNVAPGFVHAPIAAQPGNM